MTNIKVQIIGRVTTTSAINGVKGASSTQIVNPNIHPLTFIAYSDTMKARILESFCKPENAGKIILSSTEEKRDGEWHELPIIGGFLNINA